MEPSKTVDKVRERVSTRAYSDRRYIQKSLLEILLEDSAPRSSARRRPRDHAPRRRRAWQGAGPIAPGAGRPDAHHGALGSGGEGATPGAGVVQFNVLLMESNIGERNAGRMRISNIGRLGWHNNNNALTSAHTVLYVGTDVFLQMLIFFSQLYTRTTRSLAHTHTVSML